MTARRVRDRGEKREKEGEATVNKPGVTGDEQNGQAELLRDGVHLATYRHEKELLDKVRFYLGRAESRERIAAADGAIARGGGTAVDDSWAGLEIRPPFGRIGNPAYEAAAGRQPGLSGSES